MRGQCLQPRPCLQDQETRLQFSRSGYFPPHWRVLSDTVEIFSGESAKAQARFELSHTGHCAPFATDPDQISGSLMWRNLPFNPCRSCSDTTVIGAPQQSPSAAPRRPLPAPVTAAFRFPSRAPIFRHISNTHPAFPETSPSAS
jgi:hypothetical protein